nr:hypothetical protein [Bacteroides intestinalis]
MSPCGPGGVAHNCHRPKVPSPPVRRRSRRPTECLSSASGKRRLQEAGLAPWSANAQ